MNTLVVGKNEIKKAEHKWKACKLQVFYEIMKDLIRNYNVALMLLLYTELLLYLDLLLNPDL